MKQREERGKHKVERKGENRRLLERRSNWRRGGRKKSAARGGQKHGMDFPITNQGRKKKKREVVAKAANEDRGLVMERP